MAVAMAADMRFATEDSQFGIPAARLSIAYGYDGLHKLVHLVGPAMASEIMFTARRVQPDEAQLADTLAVVRGQHPDRGTLCISTRCHPTRCSS